MCSPSLVHPNQHSISTNFQWVTMPVVTYEECGQAPYQWSYGIDLSEDMICAGGSGGGGEDTCRGDSGGPLVVPKSSNDDTAVVIGATSFGARLELSPLGDLIKGCGKENYPGVFASVTSHLSWILSNI